MSEVSKHQSAADSARVPSEPFTFQLPPGIAANVRLVAGVERKTPEAWIGEVIVEAMVMRFESISREAEESRERDFQKVRELNRSAGTVADAGLNSER